jgi:RNA binding exosome subunit
MLSIRQLALLAAVHVHEDAEQVADLIGNFFQQPFDGATPA